LKYSVFPATFLHFALKDGGLLSRTVIYVRDVNDKLFIPMNE